MQAAVDILPYIGCCNDIPGEHLMKPLTSACAILLKRLSCTSVSTGRTWRPESWCTASPSALRRQHLGSSKLIFRFHREDLVQSTTQYLPLDQARASVAEAEWASMLMQLTLKP